MEGRLADLSQRLRVEQGKVRRLESRTATLETQLRSIKHTMLSVFQHATFELERLIDADSAHAHDEAARGKLPTPAPAPPARPAASTNGRQKPNGRAHCPDSPELGPNGRALPATNNHMEDGQVEDDRISLFPSEDGLDKPRQPRVDPITGQTLYGDIESEGPLMHYNPQGWLGEADAAWKRDQGRQRSASPNRTTASGSRQVRSQSRTRDSRRGPEPNPTRRSSSGTMEPHKRRRSSSRDLLSVRSPDRRRPDSRDRRRPDSRDRKRPDSHRHQPGPRDVQRSSSSGAVTGRNAVDQRRRGASPSRSSARAERRSNARQASRLGEDPWGGAASASHTWRHNNSAADAQGWNVDKGDTSGWVVNSFAGEAEMPVMRRSVAHIAEKTIVPTATDKVMEWNSSGATAGGSGVLPEQPPSRSSGTTPPRIVDDSGDADMGAGTDEDDDDEDPLSALQSSEHRSEIASLLTDESGMRLTVERLGPLWGMFGWLPLDDMPKLYEKAYETQLWTGETRSRIRRDIQFIPGLTMSSASGGPFLFRNGAHLANPRRFPTLFVDRLVPEPLLFFFVVTTVLRALRRDQGDTVAMLWERQYRRSPLGLRTVTLANQRGEVKWTEMGLLWAAAVEWLCSLGRETVRFGRAHLRDRIGGWSYDAVVTSAPSTAPPGPVDPAAELVFGLRREDLNALLDVSPMLLRSLFSERELLRLEDELRA